MENLFAGLLARALDSVSPVMGDGSRATTQKYCELCRVSGLHDGDATRCDCWCHPARAALRSGRAGFVEAGEEAADHAARRRTPVRGAVRGGGVGERQLRAAR